MVAEEPQINQGEIEVEVADNHREFGFDPDANARDESDAAGPTNRSFMCGGRWVLAAALLFAASAMFLGSASVLGIVVHNQAQAQAQAAIKEISGSGSKSDKSKCGKSSSSSYVSVRRLKDPDEDEVVSDTDIEDRELDADNSPTSAGPGPDDDDCKDSNTDAEEPDGDALRVKYEGSVTLGNLDCGSGTGEEYTECVQSAQNALKTALEEIICKDLTLPLVPPCWVVVKPNPQTEGEQVTDEAGRRRLDLLSLWEFIASITIAGPPNEAEATIDSASAAILDVAKDVAAAVGEDIEVIVEGVVAAFEVLVVELSPDPYEWAAIIPDVTGYQLVGKGYCTSSLGEYYGGIRYEVSSVQDCVAKCKASVCFAENDWTLAAVDYRTVGSCWCAINEVYEDGDSCSDPDAGFRDIAYGPGTGQPWFSGPDGQADFLCFKLI